MTSYLKLNTNAKLADSDSRYILAHFSLPAIQTCPNAGICKIGCYATQGNYRFPTVQQSYKQNWELTKDISLFKEIIGKEIHKLDAKARKAGKLLAVRIHTSGDFYSREYYEVWHALAESFPSVTFYAYTKMISLTQSYHRPINFVIISSEGGLQDSLIVGRHARVFPSIEALKQAGYDDTTTDDTIAFRSESGKIGLVYHGTKRKEWITDSVIDKAS